MILSGRFLNKQLSFAAEMGVLNLEHRTEVLRAEWVSYTPELFARLKLERGDRCYHLVRMRYVSGKPFVLVENYVPESVFPGIDAYDFAQRSLYDVLLRTKVPRPRIRSTKPSSISIL